MKLFKSYISIIRRILLMHENLINDINYLITFFEKYTNNNIKAVLGFDGFVDQILHVVKTRTDANNYIRMNTLKEFGEFICNAAGLSANVEFIPIKIKCPLLHYF